MKEQVESPSISAAIVDVIRMHPGWTMFCIVIIILAIASRIDP